jgi:iron complex outermembrane recepter protein
VKAVLFYSVLVSLIATAPFPAHGASTIYVLNIPRESLDDTLKDLSRVTGVQIARTSAHDKAEDAGPLAGRYEITDALAVLLKGKGMSFEVVSDHAVRVYSTGQSTQGGSGRESLPLLASASPAQNTEVAVSAASGDANARPGSSHSESEPELGEVVVTAEKREERLQDVPIPVTAISAGDLVKSNQLRIQDFYSQVPGLDVAPANQSSQSLSIRGVTTGGATNPTVGVMVDGVPYGASTGIGGGLFVPDFDPGDLARIEVLRGPQGTLYGAKSLGGLINFVTLEPSTDSLNGRVQAGITDVHNGAEVGYNARGSINIPVTETLAVQASAFTHEDPGYINNPVLHVDGINEERVSGGRVAAKWQPSDSFSVLVSALYQETKGDGANDVERPTPGYPQTTGLGDLQQNDLVGTGWYDRVAEAYSAVLTAKFGQATLTSLTGFGSDYFRDSFDGSYGTGPLTEALYGPDYSGANVLNRSRVNKVTEELRLATPMTSYVDWLVGVYYTHEDSAFSEDILGVNPSNAAVGGTALYISFPSTYDEYAGFANATIHFTDAFDIQLGGRESKIEQGINETEQGDLLHGATLSIPSPDADATSFTYLVTPQYKFTPDLMVYARLASGFRPGGVNVQALPGAGTPADYGPDKTQNYEIGIKSEFLDHKLTVDASIYRINWKDIQIQLENPQTLGDYTTNGGEAKSQGLELEFQARPITGLTVQGWVAWDDAVLTEDFPADSTAYGKAGDRLPGSSRFSANLGADQGFPLWAQWDASVGATVSYVGDRLGVFMPTSVRQDLPAYTRTDLRAAVTHDTWAINAALTNVTDARGILSGGLGAFPPFGFYVIQPRTFSLSVAKKF